jgi:hypothetical protein
MPDVIIIDRLIADTAWIDRDPRVQDAIQALRQARQATIAEGKPSPTANPPSCLLGHIPFVEEDPNNLAYYPAVVRRHPRRPHLTAATKEHDMMTMQTLRMQMAKIDQGLADLDDMENPPVRMFAYIHEGTLYPSYTHQRNDPDTIALVARAEIKHSLEARLRILLEGIEGLESQGNQENG